MGRSGGCCLGANCTAPPCPSGTCCHIDKDTLSDIDTIGIDRKIELYKCEENSTENCCLSKPFSLFNKATTSCGEIELCPDQSSLAIPTVFNTDGAFALLKHDGSVVTWGTFLLALRDALPYTDKAQDSKLRSNGENPHKNIVDIVANKNAFLFLDKDGWYTTWGDPAFGAINGGTFSTPNYLDEYNFGCESNLSQDCVTSEQIPQPRSRLKKGSIVPINTGLRENDIVSTSDEDFLPSKVASRGGFAGISLEGKLVIYYSDLHVAINTQPENLTPPYVLTFGGNNDGMELELPAEVKNKTDIVEVASFDHYVAARDSSNNIFILELPRVIGSPATGLFQRNNLRMVGDKRDTNKDGSVTALDALQIVNFMARYGEGVPGGLTLEEFEEWAEANPGVASSLYSSKFDVNRSGTVTALDALLVINGMAVLGGPSYDSGFTNVKKIYSNKHAFAFLLNDGKVFVWGDDRKGGDTGGNHPSLVNIKEIYNTDQAFLAHREDNKIVVWGDIDTTAGPASDFYSEVLEVFPSRYAFGLSYIVQGTLSPYVTLDQYFTVIGSVAPGKENLSQFSRLGYKDFRNNTFYNTYPKEISNTRFEVGPNFTGFFTSYSGPFDVENPPFNFDGSPFNIKRDFYASQYAFHFTDTRSFYSIGNSPDDEHNSHNLKTLSSASPITGNFRSKNYLFLHRIDRFDNRDSSDFNNTPVKNGGHYVSTRRATAFLTGPNTYVKDFSIPKYSPAQNFPYVVSLGHSSYGGAGTTFNEDENEAIIPPVGVNGLFKGLFSNEYAFCGIRFSKTSRSRFGDYDDYIDLGGGSRIYYDIITWGDANFGGDSSSVDFSSTFANTKDLRYTHEGCHPDYCDQDIT